MNTVEQLQAWIDEAYRVQKYNGEPVPQAGISRYRRHAAGAVANLHSGWTAVNIFWTGDNFRIRIDVGNGTEDLSGEKSENVGYALMQAAKIERMANAVKEVAA